MLVKQANSFRAIDDILQSQKDSNVLTTLFQKKKKLLSLVESGQLTAQKYLLICKKTMAECNVQQIKDSVDIQMFGSEDNLSEWFKGIVDDTKDKLESQNKIFSQQKQMPNELSKKQSNDGKKDKSQSIPNKNNQKNQQQNKKPTKQIKQSIPEKVEKISNQMDASKILSFKALDNLMDDNSSNKLFFMSLFEQKQKLIQLVSNKKLNPQNYQQSLQSLLKSNAHEDVAFAVQMQLDELIDFHQGKLQDWFKDRIQSTNDEFQGQKKKYQIYKTGKSNTSKKVQEVEDEQIQSITKNIAQKAKIANIQFKTELFSFRYIDDQLQKQQQNPKKFCQLFQTKTKYLEIIQKGQIDAQGYRNMLGQIIQTSTNDDLKLAAQTEVDLHDLSGDAMQFFQSSIQETGQKFEKQQILYKKYSGGKEIKINKNQKPEITRQSIRQSIIRFEPKNQPRPLIADIVSFAVLIQFLQKYKKDYDYCTQLKEKGSKLIKLVEDKKLGMTQYIKFLQAKIASSKQQDIVNIMNNQLKKLSGSKDPEKQFRIIVSDYLNKTKINLGNRSSYDEKLKINQLTINEAQPKVKIQYLLRRLGKYQSLFVYYKNNKIQNLLKQFEPQYQLCKKNTLKLCQKLKNNDAKDIDVRDFAEKNIPSVSFSVLHRESRNSYNQKLNQLVQRIKKIPPKIVEYTKQLKKSSNKNNIEQSSKMIQNYNKMISYLEGLKNRDFIPFPLVQYSDIEMYNLDLNKNLTQNQIQIIITNFQGIRDQLLFRIYAIDFKNHRFQARVQNGHQKQINVIIKIPPQIMEELIKGSSKRYLNFVLAQKGWFSETIIAQADLQVNFIRSNRMEDRLVLKHEKIYMDYIICVQKPKKPLVTKIPSIKITQFPKYEHNDFIEKEFLKTIMPFQKPTQSQIHS